MRFIRHLRNFHGTEIRAWRRGLDPDGKFAVSKSVFKQYCRTIQFEDDVKALWISLDPAGEGQLRIEQFSLQATDLLVSFRAWCISSFGSCLGLFQSMEAKKRRRQRRGDGSYFVKPSMSVNAFSSLLWAYGYPPLLGPDGDAIVWYLTTTLDLHGGSFISFSDLKWLDGWQPTEWLVTEPDHGAWLEIRSNLEAEFGNLVRAWRRELDVDNSNKFTWPQWQEVCRKRGIDAGSNVAGAWCALDQHRMGYISLKDLCKESASMLSTFKSWAETKFGSTHEAFRAMDSDGGGSLSLAELRGACYKYKCDSDPRQLFNVLSQHGRNLSRKDFHFLSDWAAVDEEAMTEIRIATENLWKEIFIAQKSKSSLKDAERFPLRHVASCSKLPCRVGSPAMKSTSSCIPVDFILGTQFPSPYAALQRPRTVDSNMRGRTRPQRSTSAPSIRAH